MRVSELANELGKTSKEVLDIIKQKDSSAALFAASSVSKDQENMVRNAVSQKKEGKTEPAKKKLTAVFRPQNAQQQMDTLQAALNDSRRRDQTGTGGRSKATGTGSICSGSREQTCTG